MIRTVLLLLVALLASLALADFCGPAYSLTLKQCKHKIAVCAPQNATLKFTGKGCRIKGHVLGDGGCQCDQYCGYSCAKACRRDKQCYWNTDMSACYNKESKTLGVPILSCMPSGTSSPSVSGSPTSTPTFSPNFG